MRRPPSVRRAVGKLSGFALLATVLLRHARRARRIHTLQQRLAMLPRRGVPLDQSVVVCWND
jgi:hypothetical protein